MNTVLKASRAFVYLMAVLVGFQAMPSGRCECAGWATVSPGSLAAAHGAATGCCCGRKPAAASPSHGSTNGSCCGRADAQPTASGCCSGSACQCTQAETPAPPEQTPATKAGRSSDQGMSQTIPYVAEIHDLETIASQARRIVSCGGAQLCILLCRFLR